jgi:hypothetical protein
MNAEQLKAILRESMRLDPQPQAPPQPDQGRTERPFSFQERTAMNQTEQAGLRRAL